MFQKQVEIQQGRISGRLREERGPREAGRAECRGLECQAKEPRLYLEGHGEPRRKVSEVGTTRDTCSPGPVFVTVLFLPVLMGVWGGSVTHSLPKLEGRLERI